MNPYQILGVEPSATDDEIAAAYRKKAFQYHPDRNQGQGFATALFKLATDARDMLKPENRAKTDARLAAEKRARAMPMQPPRHVQPTPAPMGLGEFLLRLGLLGLAGLAYRSATAPSTTPFDECSDEWWDSSVERYRDGRGRFTKG